MIEPDRIKLTTFAFELQFQVALFEHALVHDSELITKHWVRKTLTPDLRLEQRDEIQTEVRRFERAIGFNNLFQCCAGEPFTSHRLESGGKFGEIFFTQGQTGSHRMATKFVNEFGCPLGHQI